MTRNPHLTVGMSRVLQAMRDEPDGELVFSRPGGWWVGDERVSGRIAYGLLRLCLISLQHGGPTGGRESYEVYTMNEDGRKALQDPAYVPPILAALRRLDAAGGRRRRGRDVGPR